MATVGAASGLIVEAASGLVVEAGNFLLQEEVAPFLNVYKDLKKVNWDFVRLECFVNEAVKREIQDYRLLNHRHEFEEISEVYTGIVKRLKSEETPEFQSQGWVKKMYKICKNRRRNAKELKELKMRLLDMIVSLEKFGINGLPV